MTACAMQTFNQVTPAVWDCLRNELAQHQIVVAGDAGSAHAHGVYASWNYDRANAVLQLQVTKITNFFVSCSMANKYLHDAVDRCLAHHNLSTTSMIV